MSSTSLPPKIKMLLFGHAAGRCEYRGCNKLLTEDDLTARPANLSAFAHIIADSPKGPRGDVVLSPALAEDISNLMLVCLDHHKMIDVDDLAAHSVELLREHKREHEERIRLLTSIDGLHRTQLLLFEANIGPRKGVVTPELARLAVLPMYPSEKPLTIDLNLSRLPDGGRIAWEQAQEEIWRAVKDLHGTLARSPVKHTAVFAFGPIPSLMHLGLCLGDMLPCTVYDSHRSTGRWAWQPPDGSEQFFDLSVPPEPGDGKDVALTLSVSGEVKPEDWSFLLPEGTPEYAITVPRPDRGIIRTREQLADFRSRCHTTLARIRSNHGGDCTVHVIPAVPLSVAVEFGRCILPKADPGMWVYDNYGKYEKALVLLPPPDQRKAWGQA